MKFEILNLVLVATLASTTVAAPSAADQEAKKRAQAIAQLVKKNNQAVATLRRSVEATWNWHNAKKAKDFGMVSSNVTEILRLISLKEGAADCMTRGDVLALKAKAYAEPLNLRLYAEAKAAYEEAVKAQEDVDRKAKVAFAAAKYRFLAGQDPVEACEKAMVAAYNTPGLNPATKLALLKDGVPGLDYRVEGRKVAEASKDQKSLNTYYQREATRPSWDDRKVRDPLDPNYCADGMFRTCEEAIAKLEPKYRDWFENRKLELLKEMSRWDEVEKALQGRLAAITNVTDRRRVQIYGQLAEMYVTRSARYYQKPDEALTRKAIGFWEEGLKLDPKNGGFFRKIIERAMLIDDWKLAEAKLDALTTIMKDQKPDAWMTAVYGDIAYYRGDYEKAVAWYKTFEKFPDAPTVVKIPNSHQRFAGALYATGRYEECLKAIDQCPNFWSFKDTNAQYRKILKAKIEEARK